MREYLRLTRAHTAPLEIVPAVVGATLALNEFWTWKVALWGGFGLLYHLTGYGQNSLTDYVNGFDKNDPNKSHHPLNTGEMTVFSASKTVTLLIMGTILYLVISIGYTFSSLISALTASILALLMVFMGTAYNYEGKNTILKPVPISVAHSCVFAIPYMTLSDGIISMELIAGTAFVFFWVFFQIGYSGEIKDFKQDDEKNVLKDAFGLRMAGGEIESDKIYGYGEYVGSALSIRTSLYIIWVASLSYRGMIAVLMFVATAITDAFLTLSLLDRDYDRSKKISLMSGVEIMSLSLLALAVGKHSLIAVPILISCSLLWIFALNYIEWGTILAPDV